MRVLFEIEEMRVRLAVPSSRETARPCATARAAMAAVHPPAGLFFAFRRFHFLLFCISHPSHRIRVHSSSETFSPSPLPKIRGCLPPSKTMCSRAREAPSLRRVIGLNSPLAAWRAPARNPPPTFRQGNLHPVYTERYSCHYSRMPLHLPLRRAQRGQGRGSKRAFLFPHPS